MNLTYDEALPNFAFNCSLRRYTEAELKSRVMTTDKLERRVSGRGLHSSTSLLNLSRF